MLDYIGNHNELALAGLLRLQACGSSQITLVCDSGLLGQITQGLCCTHKTVCMQWLPLLHACNIEKAAGFLPLVGFFPNIELNLHLQGPLV